MNNFHTFSIEKYSSKLHRSVVFVYSFSKYRLNSCCYLNLKQVFSYKTLKIFVNLYFDFLNICYGIEHKNHMKLKTETGSEKGPGTLPVAFNRIWNSISNRNKQK